jgi:2-oxoglutarate ferredoxin oxidoreductase subunit alpha
MVGAVDGFFGKKKPEMAEANRKALAAAVAWAEEKAISSYALPEVPNPPRRLMMNGNEAIAFGAISAGLKFVSFYPMTPATSIVLNVAAQATKMGLIVEQAEDEIAAINMAIGASFAGTPAMVATSGGGFSLMVEGVSLAAMTETPVVVILAQRPGPATGLPTRTEQSDLELVLHAGHGEFPRAIFAPGTIEECFHLARRAFELAERYQGPMFVMTDQFLADSYRAVVPFEIKNLATVRGGTQDGRRSPYERFAFTDSGVSPRLLPGAGKELVVADSDEHTEGGHINEDLYLRIKMVEKRLAKGTWIESEVISPEMQGEGQPDLLLVSWGSSKGPVKEAAFHLSSEGKKVATLHFSQVWPLVPEQFMEHLESAGQVVCIEGNAFGQFARLIRRETGFHISRRVLRYDGLPFTPEWILRELEENES